LSHREEATQKGYVLLTITIQGKKVNAKRERKRTIRWVKSKVTREGQRATITSRGRESLENGFEPGSRGKREKLTA